MRKLWNRQCADVCNVCFPLRTVARGARVRTARNIKVLAMLTGVDLQALLVLVKRQPPDGRKLLVIGTSSRSEW